MDSGYDLLGRTEGGRIGESRRDQGWRRRTDLFRNDPGPKELVGSERKYSLVRRTIVGEIAVLLTAY